MKTSLKSQISKTNLYLLIAAAILFAISMWMDTNTHNNHNKKNFISHLTDYVQESEKDFDKLAKDPSEIISSWAPKEAGDELVKQPEKKYFIFIYNNNDLKNPVYWNTQSILPDESILNEKKQLGFSKLVNGYYVWRKSISRSFTSIALIPIKWNYFINNDYLRNDFVNGVRDYEIATVPGADAIKSISGERLFSISESITPAKTQNSIIAGILKILAFVLFFIFLHNYATSLAAKGIRLHKVFFFLLLAVVITRLLTYIFPVLLGVENTTLFNPVIYGTDKLYQSLGDLLINAVIYLWLVTFLRFNFFYRAKKFKVSPAYKWPALVAVSLVILFATLHASHIIRSLIADSQISFDVIDFFSLSVYSMIGFLILCCISIAYYFLCQVALSLVQPLFGNYFYELYLSVSIITLLLLSFSVIQITGSFEIFLLLWLLVYLFLLNNKQLNVIVSKYITSQLVFWILFFSLSITAVIVSQNYKKEIRNRQHYAEIIASKSDTASGTFLNTMISDFNETTLSNHFGKFTNADNFKHFSDSLINNNISGYTNNYDTRVFAFDSLQRPVYTSADYSFNQLNAIISVQAKPTNIPNLYFFDEAYDAFSYITRKEAKSPNGENTRGYVFLIITPKTFKSQALYPELFSKGSENTIENSSSYAFAVYNNGKIVRSHNDYPFSSKLPERYFAGQRFLMFSKNGFSEMWYNAGRGRYVIIAKKENFYLQAITLFSYLFCGFLVLAAIFTLINLFFRSGFKGKKYANFFQFTIRNQVHGTIIFFSIISFIIIGIATIIFFTGRYETNDREKLSNTIRIMEKEVGTSIASIQASDSLSIDMVGKNEKFRHAVNRVAQIHGVDVNLYDPKGNLVVSSLPLPYEKGIVSTKMHPSAFYKLKAENAIQFIQKENIGQLKFLSVYIPISTTPGNEPGFLNIPYFTSQSKLNQQISEFLVTIINLNAFIFLIAGIVALFITNRITRSFSAISDKMKEVNLTEVNEPVKWDNNDEIGELVKEYNKMVKKLEINAQALAKNEREGAWKEMSRQIAHEIKNPLTPMRLSMQFLQQAVDNNAPDIKELTAKLSNIMIEQIDHLNNIASEFSQFANIDRGNDEIVDINESLRSIEALYTSNESATIEWHISATPILVKADKTQINRLFTNLIQNAIQATEKSENPRVSISERLLNERIIITVEDNGHGIPDHMKERIFTPYFTTKSSGTGLGLAICKRITERHNGNLSFETSEKGTLFIVDLPVAI